MPSCVARRPMSSLSPLRNVRRAAWRASWGVTRPSVELCGEVLLTRRSVVATLLHDHPEHAVGREGEQSDEDEYSPAARAGKPEQCERNRHVEDPPIARGQRVEQ